jgi:hypothetical protein
VDDVVTWGFALRARLAGGRLRTHVLVSGEASGVSAVDTVEQLVAAVDACAAEDLHGAFAPQLLSRLGALIGGATGWPPS